MGDDLYSRQPLCQLILDEGLNFILVCKPDSHQTLYEWVDGLQSTGHTTALETKHRLGKKTKTYYAYRFVNDVPLRDGDDALIVNWCEVVVTNEKGKKIWHPSYPN